MILTGDCITVMAGMEPDSVDAVVTDPPYGLEFMGKEWDRFGVEPMSKVVSDVPRPPDNPWQKEASSYGYGKRPTAFQAWCEAWGREALRVTRPGGYLLAFGGTRTHHRLVCGLEDAGWIIRDELDWIYASGFPKGKANLKPAHEPIVLARKPGPLRPLAIDECRIGFVSEADQATTQGATWYAAPNDIYGKYPKQHAREVMAGADSTPNAGRWPSNVLLSDAELFDTANPGVVGSGAVTVSGQLGPNNVERHGHWGEREPWSPEKEYGGDSGGSSRFFIVPKADRSDREPVLRGQLEAKPMAQSTGAQSAIARGEEYQGENAVGLNRVKIRENAHPTVKPTDLMRHLVRLVTPTGGTVLDCFLGSGSTAIAAEMEGFAWVGIEKEPEYVAIAEARLNGTQRGLGLDG